MSEPLEPTSRPFVAGQLDVLRLGRVPFASVLDLQRRLVERRGARGICDTLMLCEHDPTVVVRRGTAPDELARSLPPGVDLVEVEHGDALAWHGPGQLVARPIVALPPRARDLDGYRRDLEEVVLRTLAEVEIEGERGAGGGVWVAGREVCTIDVAQRDGIAWGGLTLRLLADPPAVQALRPLGLDPARRACVEEFCELPVRTLLFEVLVVKHLCDVLDLELPPPPPPPDPGPLALFPGPGA